MKNLNDDLGYVFISERSVDDDHRIVSNVNVTNNVNLFYVTFHTNLQSFFRGKLNRNNRRYIGKNVYDKIINDKKIQCLLRDNGWFGEFEHPTVEFQGQKFSPERMRMVPPKYRAFKIMNPKLSNNFLEADIQSAQGEVGEGFGKEILAGWIPSFSLRAIATMSMYENLPTVFVRKVITYDSVWYPSHEEARAVTGAVSHIKNIQNMMESAKDTLEEKARSVIIPLKEILESVGKTDINTQIIMESFDLTMDDLCGFTNDHKHLIIKDENNTIYANISPETKKRVDDFFCSFQ